MILIIHLHRPILSTDPNTECGVLGNVFNLDGEQPHSFLPLFFLAKSHTNQWRPCAAFLVPVHFLLFLFLVYFLFAVTIVIK